MYPGHQLRRIERLGQVVIGAGRQSEHAIARLATRRQHEHWYVADPPQLIEYGETAQAGEHDIEEYEIVRPTRGHGQPCQAIVRDRDGESLLHQKIAHQTAQLSVIVDEEQRRRCVRDVRGDRVEWAQEVQGI